MIEYSFFNSILNVLKKKNISQISSVFEKTQKNKQFSSFYVDNGFKIEYRKNNLTRFSEKLSNVTIPKDTSHIKVNF